MDQIGQTSAMGLGCVETATDKDLVGADADMAGFVGYFRFFGIGGRLDGGF